MFPELHVQQFQPLIFFLLQQLSLLIWPTILNLELMSNYNFYVGGVPTQQHNHLPGGPVDYSLADPYPLTCLAWVTLPGA